MFKEKITLPKEGDLLFEDKRPWFMVVVGLFISILFIIKGITKDWHQDSIGENIFDSILILLSITWFIASGFIFLDGIRNGFYDETYKGYYFSDKIVFYRISNYVSKTRIKDKSTNELEKELERLKWEASRDGEDSIFLYNFKVNQLEEKINISKNPKAPHIIELYFSDVKYFLNQKQQIKVVKVIDNKTFYDKVKLVTPYNENPAEIVAFLNEQVKIHQREKE